MIKIQPDILQIIETITHPRVEASLIEASTSALTQKHEREREALKTKQERERESLKKETWARYRPGLGKHASALSKLSQKHKDERAALAQKHKAEREKATPSTR